MRPPLLLLGLLAVAPVHAGWGDFDYDFDANKKPWEEVQAQLPAAPKAENLTPFQVSSASAHRHFVDFTSVSAGEDGVVRYTVVVRSAGGAENISFEGMRCTTGERKLYAFGRPDGTWSRNRNARWEPIQSRQATSYQRVLFFHYFCTVEGAANLTAMQRNLRQGGVYTQGD
jgi:hypothetical protein